MRAEPPDHLTERVWQLLAEARTSTMTREEATKQAILLVRRNLSDLARRARRGHHRRYDELLERDLAAIGRLVVLLEDAADLPDGASDPQTRERICAKLAELEADL